MTAVGLPRQPHLGSPQYRRFAFRYALRSVIVEARVSRKTISLFARSSPAISTSKRVRLLMKLSVWFIFFMAWASKRSCFCLYAFARKLTAVVCRHVCIEFRFTWKARVDSSVSLWLFTCSLSALSPVLQSSILAFQKVFSRESRIVSRFWIFWDCSFWLSWADIPVTFIPDSHFDVFRFAIFFWSACASGARVVDLDGPASDECKCSQPPALRPPAP
mmetsp:Transcript_5037/g.12708  ORF Transcript_5037/g.12708 Transcript_5037/m.12708 type:complete len:218 (-) Transcript_5037:285-938(-)